MWRHTGRGGKYVTVITDLTGIRDGTGPARLRALGEGASARLKQWRVFRKVRRSANRISRTAAAVHAVGTARRSK